MSSDAVSTIPRVTRRCMPKNKARDKSSRPGNYLEPSGWWPVEGFGLDRPDLGQPVVTLRYKLRCGVNYADDIDYEVTDGQGRPVTGDWTETGHGFLTGLAAPPEVVD